MGEKENVRRLQDIFLERIFYPLSFVFFQEEVEKEEKKDEGQVEVENSSLRFLFLFSPENHRRNSLDSPFFPAPRSRSFMRHRSLHGWMDHIGLQATVGKGF